MGEVKLLDVAISVGGLVIAVFQFYLTSQFSHIKEQLERIEKRVDNLWSEHGECLRGCEHKRAELRECFHKEIVESETRLKDNCDLRHGE